MRKRRGSKEIKALVNDFLNSGMKKNEFCRERKIQVHILNNWIKKHNLIQEKKLEFVPVSITEENKNLNISNNFYTAWKNDKPNKIILKTKHGHLFKISESICISWIIQLLKELG